MRKLTSIIAAVLMASLVLSSCGDNASSSTPESSSTPSSSASSAEPSSAPVSLEADTEEKITGTVSMSGSTSMEKMAKALAESFNVKYPDVAIDIQLGGSSTGVKNAQEGVSDIGNVSRELKDTETGLTAHKVALDGIGVVVNLANPVEDLTMEQIAKIYTGEITNWSEVGGDDLEIYVVGREDGSGTRDAFESVTGVGENAKYASMQTSTGAAKTTVATTPGAIGYVSFDSVDDTVKPLKVGGVAISTETIKDGSYTLQRPFVMVTKEGAALSDAAQTFLDYVLSDEGQDVCVKVGLVSIK